ncbi:beta-galactosidase/beta-glucuronidase [Opitutaceae bacterium TAV1]|nr:beta-galactosidase/beta-glucuronidase [Opitutaceae bacterium TAV1]
MLFRLPRHMLSSVFGFPRSVITAVFVTVALGSASEAFCNENKETNPVRVEVRQASDGHWQLLRNGAPMTIKAVASGRHTPHLELIATTGANTIRTYSIPDPTTTKGPDILKPTIDYFDRARAQNLFVIPGIWLNRQDKWIDYNNTDPAQNPALARQRERVRSIVRALKNHPALLIWGLGNETEHPFAKTVHAPLWREINHLARIIKEEDPGHPVMVTIAGTSRWRIQALKTHCPDVDILGVNAYRAALHLPADLDRGGWSGPVFLGEYGPLGHWEVSKTPWDAPIEPTGEEKADTYARGWTAALGDPKGRVLGAAAFLWGQKQEATGTWYGMFLETGERTPAIDAVTRIWTGKSLPHPAPRIEKLTTPLKQANVLPATEVPVSLEASAHDGSPLTCEWKVIQESGERWGQGNKQKAPPVIPGCILPPAGGTAIDGPSVIVRTPQKPGAYRLFVFVRDSHGGGNTRNVPFLVTE